MGIKPVEKSKVIETVFAGMMDMIVTGQWKVGDKIPSENELKDQFCVSRNSIKQAIHRISALGLLEARQGGGTFVKMIDTSFYLNVLIPTVLLGTQNTIKIFEFQKGIQIECAKLACERRTDDQVEALRKCIRQMQLNLDNREDTSFLESDMEYHVIVSQMSKNELFIKATEIIERLLYFSLQKIIHRFSRNKSIDYHQRVAEAIFMHDARMASDLMDEHLSDVIQKLDEVVRNDYEIDYVPQKTAP